MTTLDEVQVADVLLHVIDCSDADREEKSEVVDGILKDLGCKKKPLIYVFNKVDKTKEFKLPKRNSIKISAQDKIGLKKLVEMIEKVSI
jgi:GTP-binding protein HflX